MDRRRIAVLGRAAHQGIRTLEIDLHVGRGNAGAQQLKPRTRLRVHLAGPHDAARDAIRCAHVPQMPVRQEYAGAMPRRSANSSSEPSSGFQIADMPERTKLIWRGPSGAIPVTVSSNSAD